MEHVKITLVKSPIGYAQNQKLTVRSLGLRRMHDSVIHVKNDAIMGMANTVRHLVKVETVDSSELPTEND